jgi:hypothetical protein
VAAKVYKVTRREFDARNVAACTEAFDARTAATRAVLSASGHDRTTEREPAREMETGVV